MKRDDFRIMVKNIAGLYNHIVYIDKMLPSIDIFDPVNLETVYHIQDEDALNMLDNIPDDIEDRDYILYTLNSAGVI